MKRSLILGKESKDVELLHQDGVTTLVWEGQGHPIDILELEPGCYSILMEGRSVEVRLDQAKSPDPEATPTAPCFTTAPMNSPWWIPAAPCCPAVVEQAPGEGC